MDGASHSLDIGMGMTQPLTRRILETGETGEGLRQPRREALDPNRADARCGSVQIWLDGARAG